MDEKYSKGQSMFELLVALSITALIMMGLLALASTAVRNSSTASSNASATRYAQEAMEFVRNDRDSMDWDIFVSTRSSSASAGINYCFNTSPPTWATANTVCAAGDYITGTEFRRDVNLRTRDIVESQDTVDVSVVVSWDTSFGEKYASLSSTLTDWKK